MDIRPAGAHALLIEVDDPAAWAADLRRRTVAAIDVVAGARTVLVDGLADPTAFAAEIASWTPPTDDAATGGERLVTIPTVYDGPDLGAVAAAWGMTVDDAVVAHEGIEFRVGFFGFAPGFAYLTGLPPSMAVARHATPRTRVPAGSVALADTYGAVYPGPTPGGWQLIGRTPLVMFDPDRDPPALLAPGDRVRFTRSEV